MSTEIFNAIAPRYDLTNYVLSLGRHARWRKKMAAFLPPLNDLRILDLATGTGDVAIELGRLGQVGFVTGVDVAEEMLKIGHRKVLKEALASKVKLLTGDATALFFADESFEVVTVAFGLRNFPDLMRGLMEAHRVLKPGGCLIALEFSAPRNIVLRAVHGLYLQHIVPFIGMVLTGKREAYRYLEKTIRAFPYGRRFARIIRQVGFDDVDCSELMMGAATIYVAKRPRLKG